jgi:hypothetical protein
MGLKSRRRGQRPRAIVACGSLLAVLLSAVSFTLARASAAPRADPLAHAPRFRRAFGRPAPDMTGWRGSPRPGAW